MTVQECANQSVYPKIWLCPNLTTSGNLSISPLKSGYECSKGTIPKEIQDKKVCKHFAEDSMTCIIWEHIPFVDGKYVIPESEQMK